jgi:UTP--glucose-1-phosphate uridylyltransferase
MVGVDFKGTRYDTGNKLGFLKAVTEIGLQNAEVGGEFKKYLQELMKV